MTEFSIYPFPDEPQKFKGEPTDIMTKPGDYIFDVFEQPPNSVPEVKVDPGRLSRLAARLDALNPDDSDLAANQRIVNSAMDYVRENPQIIKPAEEIPEKVPSTYTVESFAEDSNSAYATDLLCTAWLELYYHQVRTGDYPAIREVRSRGTSRQLSRFVPREPTEKLPDGTAGEQSRLFLTPEMYAEYIRGGLIPEGPGGIDGVPCIYWFERDGDGYKVGTNTDTVIRTEHMKPLAAATMRGTINSVTIALNKIPTLARAKEQDGVERLEAEAKRQRDQNQWRRDPGWSSWH